MFKKLLSLFLAGTLIFGNLPMVYGSAEQPVAEESEEAIIIEEDDGDTKPPTDEQDAVVVEDDASSKELEQKAEEEAEESLTGLIPNEFEAEDLEDEGIPRVCATLESSYDSRNEGLVTSVKSQLPYNTCWAFGTMAAAEGSLLKKGLASLETLDLAERHLAYFFYNSVADPLENTTGDATIPLGSDYLTVGGNGLFNTFALASWVGAVTEDKAPYSTSITEGLSDSLAYADDYHMQNCYWINMKNQDLVKQAIKDYGAVAVTYYESSVYLNSDTNAYYKYDTTGTVNHMVAIVGWDDNYSRSNFLEGHQPSSDGAWLIKNSWGSSSRNDGYFWMSYEDCGLCKGAKNGGATTAFVYDFESADNYDHNYQYDGSYGATYNFINSGGSIANIYEVKGNKSGSEKLEAVGFSLNNVSVNYSIQIYTDVKNTTDPTSGVAALAKPVTGTTSYSGYYTVPLGTSIALAEGSRYSIVITLSKSNSSTVRYMVDASYENGNWVKFTSCTQAGQSFEKDTATASWDDLNSSQHDTEDASQCAARIKGYTTDATTTLLSEIKLGKSFLSMSKGSSYNLTASVSPSSAANKAITYRSSNSSVATVSSSGKITAKGYGKAVITVQAQDEGKVSATCTVTVPYTISYVLNGGKNVSGNPSTYYNTKITLKNAKRAGYAFKGWYTNKACTSKISTISASRTGNLKLYAKWKKVTVKRTTIKTAKKASATKAKVTYSKISGAYAYQVCYSTSSKFTKKTSKSIRTKKLSYTLSKLKKGRIYYIKVRAYKRDSTGKNIYGKYSTVKKVKL